MSHENPRIGEDDLAAMGNHGLEAVGKDLHSHLHFKGPMSEAHDLKMFFTGPPGPSLAANLMAFEAGKIKDIAVVYDARPFEKYFKSQKQAAIHGSQG
jgi:hypothetical protein